MIALCDCAHGCIGSVCRHLRHEDRLLGEDFDGLAVDAVEDVHAFVGHGLEERLGALGIDVLGKHKHRLLEVPHFLLELVEGDGDGVLAELGLGLLVLLLKSGALLLLRRGGALCAADLRRQIVARRRALALESLEVDEHLELRLHRRHLLIELLDLGVDLGVERVDLLELELALVQLLREPRRRVRRVVHLDLLEVEVGLDLGELLRRHVVGVLEKLRLARDGLQQAHDLRLRRRSLLLLRRLLLVEVVDELGHLLVASEELLLLGRLWVVCAVAAALERGEVRAALAQRLLRLGNLLLRLGNLCVVALHLLQQHVALLRDRELRPVELVGELRMVALKPVELLLEAVDLVALLVAAHRLLHLCKPLAEEVELCVHARQLVHAQIALLLLQLEEALLERRVDRVEAARHLLVVLLQVVLHFAALRLDGHALVEDAINAVALFSVDVHQLRALLSDVARLLVDASAVEHQVVVRQLALQVAHLSGEGLVLPLELAVRRVVLLALLNLTLEHADFFHDLGAFCTEDL
mmetsp:Transcript_10870/g.23171  ORF Transcript_10870/g.23171 Transcript_10870/m.23171 type:complete len:526 (-) Transcript_10870:471-2048(-)